jgi:hypothetical protein
MVPLANTKGRPMSGLWHLIEPHLPPDGTNTNLLIATSVPSRSAADVNWVLSPGRPYILNNGLYIAISTTGGVFTATKNTDFTDRGEVA